MRHLVGKKHAKTPSKKIDEILIGLKKKSSNFYNIYKFNNIYGSQYKNVKRKIQSKMKGKEEGIHFVRDIYYNIC